MSACIRFGRSVMIAFLAALPVLSLLSCSGRPAPEQIVFDEASSAVPVNESMLYSRCLTWRPAGGLTVDLNPPRFSWPYEPTIMLTEDDPRERLSVRTFAFQIALDTQFTDLLVDIDKTPINFYNTIAPLPEGRELYWRAGYFDPEGGSGLEWRESRSFTVKPGATTWDRSALKEPAFVSAEHPRIIYTADRIEKLRELALTNDNSREIYEQTLQNADFDLSADWFIDFPAQDTIPEGSLRTIFDDIPPWLDPDGTDAPYLQMADRLMNMAFAWVLTADTRYLAVTERMVTLATWGAGGATRPEGMGGSPDNVSLNEYFALFYDWFYHVMTPAQKKTVLNALRWRVEHIIDNYSWLRDNGSGIAPHSVAVAGSSHPYENINYTWVAGLAAYEEGGVFPRTFELGVNFLTGVNNIFGPEDAWNEGPGYGLSKFKWMVFSSCYYDMTLNDANFGLNPFFNTIGDFFNRVAVIGLPHLSFGNIGIMEPYYLNNRLASFRKLAYLTGNGRFLQSWQQAGERQSQLGWSPHRRYSRHWIDYALPLIYDEPVIDDVQPPKAKLFPYGGWVCASNIYPGTLAGYKDNLGITFHARPRGAYNHSMFNDNSFQIYAYGENITHAGGSTRNGDRHAMHSMSQNVVLVDGLGQAQPNHTSMRNFRLELYSPWIARVARFGEQDGTVYFKGEAANAYVQYPYRYRDFWGYLGDGTVNPYDERDLSYLTRADRHVLFVDGRYFVMLDDLEVDKSEGSTFSWLYHVLQDVPLEWDAERQRFTYTVGEVTTVVQHMAGNTDLAFEDRIKEDGLVNPLTGENYNGMVHKIDNFSRNDQGPYPEVVTHNVWISNAQPLSSMRYMTVIYPYRNGSAEPVIERIDDLTARVSCGGKSELITFDPVNHAQADIKVGL